MEMVNGLGADMVVLTGDFVTVSLAVGYVVTGKQCAKPAEPCAKLLSGLRSKFGSIAVLGNHDVGSDATFVTDALRSHGIALLRNESHPVEVEGSRLWFCGLDSLDAFPKLEVALRVVPENEPVVLLVHEPDFADEAARYPVDLQLSGHSHGGQIWFPGIGAPWLPEHARKYPRGRYRVGPLVLYTNVGLGTIRVPVRLNCTPEVTLFTLRSGKTRRTQS
jgi:predicted MPP superfamily phosphohydrolase